MRTMEILCALAFVALMPSPGRADGASNAAPEGGDLAIVDFVYVDTSGEPTDQTAAHRERLQAFMAALRRNFLADGQFRLVPLLCGPVPCTDDSLAPADLVRVAADAGVEILVIGGIHKQSTLVQWAQVEAIDVAANRVVFDRVFTFRGDSDEAWRRAETFLSRDVRAALAAQQP